MVETIQALAGPEFWLLFSFSAGAALVSFYGFYHQIRRARLIEDTPTAKVRSAPQGYVELEGHCRWMSGSRILSPLSLQECVWYRYKVEKKQTHYSNGRRHTRWSTLRSGVSEALFLLDDNTAQCVIDPEGAEVRAELKRVWYGHSPTPKPHVAGSAWSRFLPAGRYRYSEEWLAIEGPLYAIGWFNSHGMLEQSSVTDDVRHSIVQWKRDPAMQARFDADGDGQLDLQEFERLKGAARQQVMQQRQERAALPMTHLLARPGDGRFYLLSSKPQHGLVRHYRWTGWSLLALALLLGSASIWLINARLGIN